MTVITGHLAISASAGTGKTFQLAHRFIRLIMLGEAPERIVALTFSRKAAREIFDRVIGYLADAGFSEADAQKRNERLGMPHLTPADYRLALRRLLDVLPRSRVGTIDSFVVGVVRAFPYELGLEPGFEVFDSKGLEAQWFRREALRAILMSSLTREDEWRNFFESFKYATFGFEEKRSGRILNELLEHYQNLYRLQPDGRHWGLDAQSGGHSISDTAAFREVVAAFRTEVLRQDWKSGVLDYWEQFCDELLVWSPEAEFEIRVSYVFKLLLPQRQMLGKSPVPLKFNRTEFILPVSLGAKLVPILQFMADEIIRLYSIRTKGMFRLVERCEEVYDDKIRRRGMLTFEDALFALCQRSLSVDSTSVGHDNRLSIDYRLDGKLDHWLLDEFQDTSTLQWHVLSGLIDEVIQDPEKRRSFFYVGDVKQAIYGWRGGNADLFNQILEHYNQGAGPVIERRPLGVSFRSARPIIDTVNQVFGNLSSRIGPEVAALWARDWQEHDCDSTVVPDNGYSALVVLPARGSEDTLTEDDTRYVSSAGILAHIDPVRRGLSAAVLCRGNEAARRMAEVLRERHPEIHAVLEGQVHICDNPAVSLLLSLLQWAEHPGDRFAECHLKMSVLGDQLPPPAEILAMVQLRGFRALLATWILKLESRVTLTPFERMRLGQLLDFAALADRDPSRHIDRFVASVREFVVEESSNRAAVRIMTIHKAKGLDFDVVILPDLQPRPGSNSKDPMVKWSDDQMTPEWILQPVRSQHTDLDDRLKACRHEEDVRESFEKLCVLYVAMTRASRAMYMVVTQPSEKSTASHHANILFDSLVRGSGWHDTPDGVDGTIAYESGDPDWFVSLLREQPTGAVIPPSRSVPINFIITAEDRATPSRGAEFERKARLVFEPTLRARRETGTAVHALWQKVEWLGSPGQLLDILPEESGDDVRSHFERCAGSEEVLALFHRPAGTTEVWREQAFEVVLDGTWISGVFDRVVVYRETDGSVTAVDVIDFKTNHLEDDPGALEKMTDHYRPQMEIYRDVIVRLLGVDAARVRLLLLFSALGRVAVVSAV